MTPTPLVPPTITTQINRRGVHADPAWRKAALATVKRLARKRETFTSFDVLERLDKSEAKTSDLRAVGSVMIQARNLGIIANAGLIRRSNRHSRGATTLWRSLLIQQPPEQPSSPPAPLADAGRLAKPSESGEDGRTPSEPAKDGQ